MTAFTRPAGPRSLATRRAAAGPAEAVLRGVLAARGLEGDDLPHLPAVCDL